MWAFLLDLRRQVSGILRPAHGGTGSTYGEQRVVAPYLNSTGSSLALWTLVQLSAGANDVRVKKVADTNSVKVLGVVVGYFDGTGALVEASAADGAQVAVQTAGRCPILIESAVTREQYAFAAATDGKITSSATAAAGAFGRIIESADVSTGQTTAMVVFPIVANVGAGITSHAALSGLSADDHTHYTLTTELDAHDHDGTPTPKLVQANTHESADTDASGTALHHTLGTGANQAAKGTHTHAAGGSATNPIYFPDYPPASPHANDDEFNDSSVDGDWTEWDLGTIFTPSEGAQGLTINPTDASIDKWCGYYRALPRNAGAGDFAVMTKVTGIWTIPAAGDFWEAGIVLLESPGSSTGDVISFALATATATGSSRGVRVLRWSGYDTFVSTLIGHDSDGLGHYSNMYLRVRRIGTTWYYDWSSDGEGWTEIFNHTPPFTIANVGLGLWAGSNREKAAYFRFWRQIDSGTFKARINGQVLDL